MYHAPLYIRGSGEYCRPDHKVREKRQTPYIITGTGSAGVISEIPRPERNLPVVMHGFILRTIYLPARVQ